MSEARFDRSAEYHPWRPEDGVSTLARRIRALSLHMVHDAKASHIGGCLSMADVLAVLYGGYLRIDGARPTDPGRDRFILSKGHAAAAIYATLALRGFFPFEWLDTYCRDGARLGGHITHRGVPGVELSTGSLGHGLPVGMGMALGLKRTGSPSRVVVLLSDGECDEGSNWESALLAPQFELSNLRVIIDYNRIQSLGRVEEVAELEPFADKWRAFRWNVIEIDGHDLPSIQTALAASDDPATPDGKSRPTAIIARTIKGKGVSFMEDLLRWHYSPPRGDELGRALAEVYGEGGAGAQ